MIGAGDAWIGRAMWIAVQLRGLGGAGWRGPSVAADPGDRKRGLGGSDGRVRGALSAAAGSALDPAGAAAAGDAAAGVLRHPLGASADGADGVRPSVPLVRGAGVDDPAWDHSSFSKNRDRLLEGEIAAKFLRAVLAQPRVKRLLSSDHFSVDGTLIEAWASIKSFRRKDGGRQRHVRDRAATPSATSTRRSAPTRRTAARPILRRGSTRRAMASRPGSATWATR